MVLRESESEPMVLYLDENTPLPALPAGAPLRKDGDGEILYIQD